VEHQEGKAERLDLQTWLEGKNWEKAGVRENLSSGMRLRTWTSFVGCRIDVRRGRKLPVSPSINVRKGTHRSEKKYIYIKKSGVSIPGFKPG
jgi:hypothetical protein